VDLGAVLSWNPGSGATSQDVYFGTSSSPPFIGNQTASSYDPGILQPDTTYYWQINEVVPTVEGPPIIYEGDVWSFTTVYINVAPIVDIGSDQIVHEGDVVIFSPDFTDPDELDSHTATWDFGDGTPLVIWPFKNCKFDKHRHCEAHRCKVNNERGTCQVRNKKCVCVSMYDMEILVTHTYGDDGVYTVTLIVEDDNGGIGFDEMSVTVLPTVDNFEDYNDYPPDRIFQTWIDGVSYSEPPPGHIGNGTGSIVLLETEIVHAGAQSMYYDYNNGSLPYYSETERTFDTPQDWTSGGVKALSLWFHGNPTNDSEPIYMAVEDSTGKSVVVYHDNPDAAQIDSWTGWYTDLRQFAYQGVDLADVNSIAIGFGNRYNPQPGGRGTVYFDNIKLGTDPCPPCPIADDVVTVTSGSWPDKDCDGKEYVLYSASAKGVYHMTISASNESGDSECDVVATLVEEIYTGQNTTIIDIPSGTSTTFTTELHGPMDPDHPFRPFSLKLKVKCPGKADNKCRISYDITMGK